MKLKTKTVKAWAVVTKRGDFLEALSNQWMQKWGNLVEERVLHCTITYDLPKKRAKK